MRIPLIALTLGFIPMNHADSPLPQASNVMKEKFDLLNRHPAWAAAFLDPGTEDWRKNWSLDGESAEVINTPKGMELRPGEKKGEAGGHMVLWTKPEFHGDVKVSFKFTRLDQLNNYVNILYLYATGTGEAQYAEDISQWADLRKAAAMKTYYENMRLLHVSFAAYGRGQEYIRARRYPTGGRDDFKRFDTETVIPPDYPPGGLFQPNVEHTITAIRSGNDLFMEISNGSEAQLCHWDLSKLEPLDHGRIGLRLMAGRASRIENFRVEIK